MDLALYFAPVDSLRTSLLELKRERKLHPLVLSVLQELANHSSFQVRRYVAILYGVSVRVCVCVGWGSQSAPSLGDGTRCG